MYSLEQLQQKNIKQLKEIGWQLNVLPEGDKRCRQNWIDAIVGVNPPLLQLLEASPAGQKVELPAKPIAPAAKTKKRTQKPIELALDEELPSEEEARSIVSQYFISTSLRKIRNAPPPARVFSSGQHVRIIEVIEGCNRQFCGSIGIVAEHNFNVWVWVELDGGGRKIVLCRPEKLELIELVAEEFAAKQESIKIQRQEPIAQAVKNSPAVDVARAQEPIVETVETSPGVKTEATAIGSAAKNPILTGVTFSDRFLARYSPPRPEIIHFQSDADGQLSLLDFEIESVDEPPDPDDFESLDAFREALARWDWEHNEVSPEHNEPLQVSLDSFSLWGLCPADWYEPAALLEPSSMLELSQTRKSSITSDFFIPTFDCLSDRSNKGDEPPDTGVFAKLPKPNPPSFPPAAVGQVRAKLRLNSAQMQSKRIPNAYQTHTCCILAGSSIQPARSPPGGDAGF